jgi:hypothetical protein
MPKVPKKPQREAVSANRKLKRTQGRDGLVGRLPAAKGLVQFLRASPLAGVELDLERDQDRGRPLLGCVSRAYHSDVTKLLGKAFEAASDLPAAGQDELAARILDEVAWDMNEVRLLYVEISRTQTAPILTGQPSLGPWTSTIDV